MSSLLSSFFKSFYIFFFFFFNDTATTEIYTLSLHDALPISGAPPSGLLAFYWHFVSQTKGWYAAMFAASLAVALLDTVIPLFIGRLVALMESTDRMAALAEQSPLLIGMVALVLIVRPLVLLLDVAIRHNALIPGATSLIR